MSDGETLATIARGPKERIVIELREYRGRRFLDLREYFRTADGRWQATRRGVAIKLHELRGVHEAIEKACTLAENAGR